MLVSKSDVLDSKRLVILSTVKDHGAITEILVVEYLPGCDTAYARPQTSPLRVKSTRLEVNMDFVRLCACVLLHEIDDKVVAVPVRRTAILYG